MKKTGALLAAAFLALYTGNSFAVVKKEAADQSSPSDMRRARLLGSGTNLVWIVDHRAGDSVSFLQETAYQVYDRMRKTGFQQSHTPNFLISDRNHTAVFGIGGYVAFRTAYDFGGVVDDKDFITWYVPTTRTADNRQRLLMDGSTSRLFFKTIIDPTHFRGPIEAYIESDFRGGSNVLRLREAYIALLGFTFGQTASTFADLNAAPNTIDFQGPNGYTYHRNLMIRYQTAIGPHWEFAVALEMPEATGTVDDYHVTVNNQRIPDLPFYFQYNWNEGKSHIRASGLLRGMNYANNTNRTTYTQFGWGAMLSGAVAVCRRTTFFGQVAYGKGVAGYLQDLQGQGADLVQDPGRTDRMQVLPALGWLAGAQVKFTSQWQGNLVYSQVNLYSRKGYFATRPDVQYRFGQYVAANIFYTPTADLDVGLEYLYGTRKNAGTGWHHANRMQMMVRYNF